MVPAAVRALSDEPGLQSVFDGLARSARYQLMLPVLAARTATARAAAVRRAVTALRSVAQG